MKTDFSNGGATLLQSPQGSTFGVLLLLHTRVVLKVLHRALTGFAAFHEILLVDGFMRLLHRVPNLVGQSVEVDGRFADANRLSGLEESRQLGLAEQDGNQGFLRIEV